MGRPRTVRLPSTLEKDLEREFALRGVREWSSGIIELLSEAVRMRKVPGIGFTDSVTGRRAVLTGTGIEVWEIIAMWRSLNENEQDLLQAYAWLPATQVRSALAYYRLFPEEVDARLNLENEWSPEDIRGHLPTATFGPGVQEDR